MQNFIELDLVKGQTFSQIITVTDNLGNSVSLSGYNVLSTIRRNIGVTGVLGQFNASLINATGNQVQLQLYPSGSTGFANIRAVADLIAYDSGNINVIGLLPYIRLNIYESISTSEFGV